MEYKFNAQHIADLSGGKVILAHTKKDEDLPLLKAAFKAAAINEDRAASGKYWLYFRSNGVYYGADWHTELPEELKFNLPIIPLHDFLAKYELPKEDLDRIDLMDKRLKELEGIVKDNGNQEFIQWLTSIDVANKIVKMFEGEMKQAPETPKPKHQQPFHVVTFGYDSECHDCYIQVASSGIFTKDQADQTADLIRWVLDNQETVLKLKNQ